MVIVKGIDNFFLVMTFNKELLSTFPVLLLQWNSYLNTRQMPWKGPSFFLSEPPMLPMNDPSKTPAFPSPRPRFGAMV